MKKPTILDQLGALGVAMVYLIIVIIQTIVVLGIAEPLKLLVGFISWKQYKNYWKQFIIDTKKDRQHPKDATK